MIAFKNISIKNKLIVIQSLTAFIAILICCIAFALYDIKIFKASYLRKMDAIARIVGANSVTPLLFMDADAASKILINLNKEADIFDAIILDKNGKIFSRYNRNGENIPIPDIESDKPMVSAFHGKELIVKYKVFQDENEFLGTVIIRAQLTDLNRVISNYFKIAFLVLFGALIAAVVISAFLHRVITTRLLSLVNKTREVAETGNYSSRVSFTGKDEIAVLSKEYNHMLQQIEKMERSLKDSNNELEKRVSERTIELQTANKELESFSYSVSHDLKAPLRAISGYSSILKNDYIDKLDDNAKVLTESIMNNAQRMGKLIEDLLSFSQLRGPDIIKNNVDMNAVVEKVLLENKDLEKGRAVSLKIEELIPAKANENLIKQVWSNLILNAFKYTGQKANAEITIGSYIKKNEDTLKDEIVYFVKDNGVGFDMKYVGKLFGVFQRLHGANEFEGTGVGLAIVKRIVNKHGGDVWAESIKNEGATFYFKLPKQ